MNDYEKMILKSQLSEEEKILKLLQREYQKAKTECVAKIAELDERFAEEPLQSIVYQKKYQDAILQQINSTLKDLQTNNYKSIDDYLHGCYENGFIGSLYSINQQGLPILMPIDQQDVIQAIYHDTKLSHGMYDALGEDIENLKVSVKTNLSRGIIEGKSWQEVAEGLANEMVSPFRTSMYNSMRIARTEGGRVSSQAQFRACQKARERGADIVKQWDSTLDGRTRESHRTVDGEVRELDEKFSNGLLFPHHPDGSAGEVINCRCAMLQRARWALKDGFTKMDNFTGQLLEFESPDDYKTFKKDYFSKENVEYMQFVYGLEQKYNTVDMRELLSRLDEHEYKRFKFYEERNPLLNKDAKKSEPIVEEKPKINGWQGLGYSNKYKTKAEAIEALQNVYGIKFEDSSRYAIDEKLLTDFVSWMDAFTEQYKVLIENNPVKLPLLVVMPPSKMKRALGYFSRSWKNVPIELALNGKYHCSMTTMFEYARSVAESNWSVANADQRHTFVHEFGHYIHNIFRNVRGEAWIDNFMSSCVAEYKAQHPESAGDSAKKIYSEVVSRYGSTQIGETFAECFSEFFGGENPREFATIFGTKLDALMKNAKMSDDGMRLLLTDTD